MGTTHERTFCYVVYFTKGLADVVVSEIAALAPGIALTEPTDRFVVVSADTAGLARLRSGGRTFDDIRVLAAGPSAVADAASFDQLCARAAEATVEYLGTCDPGRAGSKPWSVTMSAPTPGWRRQPRWDPSGTITARLAGADLRARSRSDVDLRIQVDGEQAHISVSLGPQPHGKRESGGARPGALRASVAASLVRLAIGAADSSAASQGLYDPCCGTGTIPAEAARLSVPVYASDADAEAVAFTEQRLAALAGSGHPLRQVRVFQHDLRRGNPARRASTDRSQQSPMGKAGSGPRKAELLDAVAALTARGLAEGGASALLTTSEQQLVARIRRHAPHARIATRRIGLLGPTPAVVVAAPR